MRYKRGIRYDAVTTNGVQYLSGLYAVNYEYERVINDLDSMAVIRTSILSGSGSVSSYTIGSRSLSRQGLSASELLKLWDDLWNKKMMLERGGTARKAVGVVYRDW